MRVNSECPSQQVRGKIGLESLKLGVYGLGLRVTLWGAETLSPNETLGLRHLGTLWGCDTRPDLI